MFPGSTLLAGPKHSTSVPFRVVVAVPLSVDVKEVALVPKPDPGRDVKVSLGPQTAGDVCVCTRVHSSIPATLHVVTLFKSPPTVHLKVNGSPGQVGGAAVNCPVTSPEEKYIIIDNHYICYASLLCNPLLSQITQHTHMHECSGWAFSSIRGRQSHTLCISPAVSI